MKIVKDFVVALIILFLMIIRGFVGGKWVSCLVILSFLISLFDLLLSLYNSNNNLHIKEQKVRFVLVFIVLCVILFAGIGLILSNIIFEISFLNSNVFLDELTLATLLLTLPQDLILLMLNKKIKK